MIKKKKVEEYIPRAMKYIENKFDNCKENGLPDKLHGYITNFGASIIQSGLIPAVAFYERKETTSKDDVAKNRRKLMRIIFELINKEDEDKKEKLLIEYLVKDKKYQDTKDYKIKNDIIHAAIAMKLAIRLYKQVGDDDE